uniref:Putative ATPase domain containing protein n=2 Tax=viral metagenome TaxID=1070528 RepID=A0A6H1ZMU3_9ZZZZ
MKITIPPPKPLNTFMPDFYRILIYGIHGAGKSEFAGTWAEAGEVLYLDSDRGLLTIIASSRLTPELKSRIFTIPIIDTSEDKHIKQPIGLLTVKAALEEVHATGKCDQVTPVTVVVDSTTTLSDYAMSHALFISGHTGQQPSQPDWGRQMREMHEVITLGIGLKCNFICIAHEQYIQDKLSGRTWCLPLVTGKFAHRIGGYFDEVYHAQVSQVGGKHSFELETKPSGLITAKSRLDLPSVIATHYSSIRGRIEALRKQQAQATQTIQPVQEVQPRKEVAYAGAAKPGVVKPQVEPLSMLNS